jgi:hypothetical protein
MPWARLRVNLAGWALSWDKTGLRT